MSQLASPQNKEAVPTVHNLKRSLGRLDMIFLTVAATIGIDTIAQIAGLGGAQAFTWAVVLVVTFMFPYALVMAELGSTFSQEGGPYVWVRLAHGKAAAAVSTMFYWITNPVWLGGSLAFISAATWTTFIQPMEAGSFGDYLFKFIFIWVAIFVSVISLRFGKILLNIGAIVKVGLLIFFVISVAIYAGANGVRGYGAGDFSPTLQGFLEVTPVLLFAFVGFEAQNGAAEEMRNPKKDVPKSIAVSAVVSALCYLVPIFAILAVLPESEITGAGGLLEAMATVFSVYGDATPAMIAIAALLFIFVVLTQGAAWMIASDRVQASAAADGAFPRYFGVFNARFGTPVRVNILSGVIATEFMVCASLFLQSDGASAFAVVLGIAVTTLLISYLWIFPTIIRLRKVQADVPRPYSVPGGKAGLWLCTIVITAWVVLGTWSAIFPGTIQHALGLPYDFEETWSMSQFEFEAFTLGTLAVISLIALGGYALARKRDTN
ncbi:APC family permease [Paenarthrobacter sp. NPDC089714]|uniref:APC family permease n=1 Tax=Paenarthrobacter sp. NPDC089714 TaxID=3364377 RepID=UPI0038053C39